MTFEVTKQGSGIRITDTVTGKSKVVSKDVALDFAKLLRKAAGQAKEAGVGVIINIDELPTYPLDTRAERG